MRNDFIIAGNMNVGKTTLFNRLCRSNGSAVNIPGTTMRVKSGPIKGMEARAYDTPGTHSIYSFNEDERASRDLLLLPATRDRIRGLILVADAKNLKRSVAMALQYAEYGLPMILDINMIDEAASRGISIDTETLAHLLGIGVYTTIANQGVGVEGLRSGLKKDDLSTVGIRLSYPDEIENFIGQAETLLPDSGPVSPRSVALLLMAEDPCAAAYVRETGGEALLEKLEQLAAECEGEACYATDIFLENLYLSEAEKIVNQVQTVTPPTKNPFIVNLGDWSTRYSTGIPIALAVVACMYLFVGSFAATFLVDNINGIVFEGALIPFCDRIVGGIPSAFIRDLIMDPDFGVLPTGVFLALGLVLPVIFCFYIAFGVLEDSGYLPRLSILLDRVFKKMGMNGKGVIPLVMGFSCITMAILTTRMLNSEKEKNTASFLVFLCMPCAPLLAVMLIILDDLPFYATATVFTVLFLQIFIAGWFADRILPGFRSSMIMEIPAMRVPQFSSVVTIAARKSYHFMKEAIPVFVLASAAVFLFQRMGGLELLEHFLGPVIGRVLGLPEQSIQVFIKTMIRRESGAAELQHLAGTYTHLQLVVNLLVMTLIAPCINAIIVLVKERGMRTGAAIIITGAVYAVVVGSLVNFACIALGITFE